MKRTYWVASYRAPADNYEHVHIARVISDGIYKKDAEATLKKHTNLDMHVESLTQYASLQACQDALLEATATAISGGGPEYRSLQESEEFVTARKAKLLLDAEGRSTSNIKISPSPLTALERAAEARGEMLTDPPAIITP